MTTATLQTLSARLTTLFEQNKAVQQLIHRLSKLNFGTTSDEGNVRLELTSEIHESLKQLDSELDVLRDDAEGLNIGGHATARDSRRLSRDTEKDRERTRIVVQVSKLAEDLRASRSQFNHAQRLAKRNAELASKKERDLLFANVQSGSTTPNRRKGKDLSADEVLVNASSDVTAALRRTHQLMQSELSRSRFAQETLEQSTAALADLGEHYTNLSTLLSSSRTLLTTLVQSQKSDTWYLETAFYILVTTILWLVFRRFLYGPLWWLVYFPLKLTYKLALTTLAAIGVTGGAVGTTSLAAASSPSTSLIVKPSATGRPPVRMAGQAPSMRVGGGGYGAKYDPSDEGSMSRVVGQMAEKGQGQQHHEVEMAQGEAAKELPRRGDGQPLVESDKPRNPKKRMFDVEVEDQKREEAGGKEKDEL